MQNMECRKKNNKTNGAMYRTILDLIADETPAVQVL